MRMMDTVGTMFAALEREPRPSDLDLEDMSLSRSDYDTLSHSPKGARERMVFMAERFGISEKQLSAEHWRAVDVARTCAICGVATSCEKFRRGKKTNFSPASCPNAPRFSELTV